MNFYPIGSYRILTGGHAYEMPAYGGHDAYGHEEYGHGAEYGHGYEKPSYGRSWFSIVGARLGLG